MTVAAGEPILMICSPLASTPKAPDAADAKSTEA